MIYVALSFERIANFTALPSNSLQFGIFENDLIHL